MHDNLQSIAKIGNSSKPNKSNMFILILHNALANSIKFAL